MTDINELELPEYIRPGNRFSIGSYTFDAEQIIGFASKWDPQPFHLDAEKAKKSLFGGLCASGWHTASVWMKLQRKAIANRAEEIKRSGGSPPEIGPSPGMKKLKWLKPVFAGDTITYYNKINALRASNSKPSWHIMTSQIEAENQNGEPVMTFESAVFLKLP